VRRIELTAVGEQLGEYRGRRHRQRTAEADAGEPRHAGGGGRDGADGRRRQGHLSEAEAEDDALHRIKPRQRKFQADGEHQEHDAKLGQVAGALGVRQEIERVRPHHHADQQIAEDGRQVGDPAGRDHQDRRAEQQQYQLQRVQVVSGGWLVIIWANHNDIGHHGPRFDSGGSLAMARRVLRIGWMRSLAGRPPRGIRRAVHT
jgi:hypothetical protein